MSARPFNRAEHIAAGPPFSIVPPLPPLLDSHPRVNNRRRDLRVLVNAVSARSGGGLTYALEQITALARQPGLALTVVAVEPLAVGLAERAPSVMLEVVPRRPVVVRFLWEQTVLMRRARSFDVVYGIGNFALLLRRRHQVVTFQNPSHFGRYAQAVNRRLASPAYRLRMAVEARLARLSARRADVAVAISRTMRESMLESAGDCAPRVITSAAPVDELPAGGGSAPSRPTPDGYVLAVANDYPHKDWDGLIDAFLATDAIPPLVLVGAPRSPARAEELRAKVAATGSARVVLWGAERDRGEIDALYRGATAYIAHSYLEAFALTPLEALARGLHLAASDIASHREVCGDYAEYYDPSDPHALASAVQAAIARPRPKPWQQVRTWDDVALELAEALESAGRRP